MTKLVRVAVSLAGLAFLLAGGPIPASAGAGEPKGERYAFLVACSEYDAKEFKPLKFTRADMADFADVLKQSGWRDDHLVLMHEGQPRRYLPEARKVREELKLLLAGAGPDDTVVAALSGHGVQFTGDKHSYFCPVDARLDDKDTLLSLAWVYEQLDACKAGRKLLLVDACRNDPYSEVGKKGVEKEKLESVTRPQAEAVPKGIAALFSCDEGQESFEDPELKHGVFFHHVLKGWQGEANSDGPVTLNDLIHYISKETPTYARVHLKAAQAPVQKGEFNGGWVLAAAENRDEITNTIGMKLKRIKAGKFTMGSPNDEEGRIGDSRETQHEVEITRAYYIGIYPVTKGQFAAFADAEHYKTEAETDGVGANGYIPAERTDATGPKYNWKNTGWEQTDAHPAVNVTWNDAQKFCAWLTKKEGKIYDLPTEAEWEYACRAGTKTRFWCGEAEDSLKGNANICDGSLKDKYPDLDLFPVPWDDGYPFTSPVGKFGANAWGLYDMHGNVKQWCADHFGAKYQKEYIKDPKGPGHSDLGEERVVRGCSWMERPWFCRSASRSWAKPNDRGYSIGFRVVLRPAAKTP